MKPQHKFPLLERYREVFPITENTIFAYDGEIYSNNKLPHHLVVHEQTHHKQQKEMGLDKWVDMYLKYPQFRLTMEVQAYRNQLKFLPRKEKRKVLKECIKTLSSNLYGNLVTKEEAKALLT